MKIKRIFVLFLIFIIPIFLIVIAMIFNRQDINYILYLPDVSSQYVPLFKYLRGIYLFDNSLVYFIHKGMGGSMFSTFFYYLSSPLNIVVLLFKNIVMSLNIIILLKIGLCSLSMYLYLTNKYKKNYILIIIFSIIYALMGYNICFVKNLFWFDVVYITPLVMLGIDYIIYKSNPKLYIICLSYCMICNYYTSFSLCIFCVIYFLYEMFVINKDFNCKKVVIFLLSSLLSAAISAIVIIPVFFEMMNLTHRIGSQRIIEPYLMNFNYIFYSITVGSNTIANHFFTLDEFPNIYCGMITYILIVLFFVNKNISKKNKIFVAIIECFFLMTMIFTPLYNFWHGFSTTVGNKFRFSYLWSFFNIYLACQSFNNLKSINKKNITFSLIIMLTICFLNLLMILTHEYFFFGRGLELYLTVIFIILYYILLYNKKKKIIIVVVILELFINILVSIRLPNNEYKKVYVQPNCFEYPNNEIVRVDTANATDSMYCNYGALSSNISTTNENMINLIPKIGGISIGHTMSVNNEGIMQPLLNIKYSKQGERIYSSAKELSVGYMVYKKSKIKSTNAIEYHTSFLNSMINKKYLYYNRFQINKINSSSFYYVNNSNKDKYILLKYKKRNIKSIYVNDEKINAMLGLSFSSLIKIENDYEKDRVNIEFNLMCDKKTECSSPNVRLYEIDNSNLQTAINILKKQQLKVTKMKKNILEGNINVKKDNQYLFLSIPYEKGWNIYVDGKKVNYEKIYDAFIGIKLNKGHHKIQMKFYPYGFKIGCVISGISVVIFAAYCFITKRKK